MSYNNNEPSKVSGQFHSVKGTVVEMVGNLTGAESWQQSGKKEHVAGEVEYNAAQSKEYVNGASDRLGGKIDSVVGAVAGDKQQQISGNARHDAGKARMDINEPN